MANKYTAQQIDIQKAVSLYQSGMTQTEVAKTLGTSQKVIFTRFRKIGLKCRIPAKRDQRGPKNSSWKSKDVTYSALHYRVCAVRGRPKLCAMCDTTEAPKYEWANLTGDYRNIHDYARLCGVWPGNHVELSVLTIIVWARLLVPEPAP